MLKVNRLCCRFLLRQRKNLKVTTNHVYALSCCHFSEYNACPPYNVLFFGSDEFALTCLKTLKQESGQHLENIEAVGLPAGRYQKSVVQTYAEGERMQFHIWPHLPNLSLFDVGIVVSFGKLIPKHVIDSFRMGILNVHPSFLPSYRGASPIARAIEAGETSTGVSIITVSPHCFDHGNIVAQTEPVAISNRHMLHDVEQILSAVGAKLLLQTISFLPTKLIQARPQEGRVCHAPKITLEDTLIDFHQLTSDDVINKYRAFGFQKVYYLRCFFGEKMIRLVCISKDENFNINNEMRKPGLVQFDKKSKSLVISCKEGAIRCTELILSKKISATDFYNGQMQTRLKRGEDILFCSNKKRLCF